VIRRKACESQSRFENAAFQNGFLCLMSVLLVPSASGSSEIIESVGQNISIKGAGEDLLIPAVEPEPAREPVIYPAPNSPDSGVMVY
jgi:hypothetical protein